MSYWNADSDLDWSGTQHASTSALSASATAAANTRPDWQDRIRRGMDVHACPKCRGAEEDEDADRGDWECHQRRGE